MPILRVQKEQIVGSLAEELKNSRIALLFTYHRLTNDANKTLRDTAFGDQGKIRMVSNNLLRLILKSLKLEFELPEKPLALAYGFTDEVTAAKTLVDFAKQTEALEPVAGWVDGRFFTGEEIRSLAALPGRNALQAQLVGRLGGLIHRLVYNLNFPLRGLVFVTQAIAESKK